MKKKMITLLTIIMTVLVSLTIVPGKIYAAEGDGPTVREYENGQEASSFYTFDLMLENYDAVKSNIPTTYTVGNPGDSWQAYYPNVLDYYGEKKSIKIDIKFVGYNRYKEAGDEWYNQGGRHRGIVLEGDNGVALYAIGMDYDVTYTFYDDPEFTTPAYIYGGIEFNDPDLGNYIYEGANTKDLLFINKKGKSGGNTGKNLIDYYNVLPRGVFQINEDYLPNDTSKWPDFNDGTFAVPLKKESTFSFTAEGKHDYLRLLADVIQTMAPYKVEYYYETSEGYPETPDYATDEIMVDLYKNPTVSVTDDDKTPNPEKGDGYVLDKEKNTEWSKTLEADGSTVLRVYFNMPYTIKYDKNAEDATGEMADDNYTKSDPKMPSKEEWTFERPGYEFIGYKVENTGELLTDPDDYKETLLNEDDREIVLYAQWKPLDYKIIYNKNAEDATGEMADDDYTGADEKMPSKDEWTFERPGYEFIGYKVENTGELLTDPDDYKEMLLKEDDREVELYAQWNPLPYKIIYNKNAEDAKGEMADDDYTGADPLMPSKENWTYTREGYDFVGFKLENKGNIRNGSQEYKEVLLKEEDREIELFAQWDPWKYTIKYDPNGGTGEMPDHIYKYDDPDMNSDPNQYTRKGYKFEGFVYTDPDGNSTLYKNINDFKEVLIKLGKNSEILLVAQWKKIPDSKTYYIPVTGVE